MALALNYSIALFSGQACQLFHSSEYRELLPRLSSSESSAPSAESINACLKGVDFASLDCASRLLILIPDEWLSVTQHSLDHPVSARLLPLAALSFAVESTYATPDNTLYAFQHKTASAHETQLTVYACSKNWSEPLFSAFQQQGRHCILVAYSQFKDFSSRSWSYCTSQQISGYRPEYEKQQKVRRCLWLGVILSLVIHCLAVGLYWYLEQAAKSADMAYQQVMDVTSNWSQDQLASPFVLTALNMVQSLPDRVRVETFQGHGEQAQIHFSLPHAMLKRVLDNWRSMHPQWRWKVEKNTLLTVDQEEVVNVSVQVFRS
ncbi:hypothetical protein [Marinomonas posidonica]|uniref:hypothetical protein n=1 Tax=Marinomonas posidonica TaxID=936476 RepID=UPI0037356072